MRDCFYLYQLCQLQVKNIFNATIAFSNNFAKSLCFYKIRNMSNVLISMLCAIKK